MEKKLRILNLEDNPNDTDLIKETLEAGGIDCEITRVETEEDFLCDCGKGVYDIILSDYSLPSFDGLSALKIAMEKCPDIPFIFVSGKMGEDIAVESLKNGATDYILKNNFKRLVLSVRRALKEAEMLVERKQREENLRKVINGIINALVLAVEARDPYTAGHQRRVAQLAMALAADMKLPAIQIEGIAIAASIHDIGKISVPADILSKPAVLNEIEYQMVKIHPVAGYRILKDIEFPWPIASIVLQHHERLDGSGYPDGISGDEILLETRIVSVADVVEAIASHRPYRPAFGINIAIEEISRKRGTLYDPEAVDACLRLFNEKGFKFE